MPFAAHSLYQQQKLSRSGHLVNATDGEETVRFGSLHHNSGRAEAVREIAQAGLAAKEHIVLVAEEQVTVRPVTDHPEITPGDGA